MKTIANAFDACADDSFDIDAIVLIKPFVLYRYKSMLHCFGDFIQGDIYAVRAGRNQLGGFFSLVVQNDR